MIDIKELREAIQTFGSQAINEGDLNELLDRLEAAESDALEQARLNGMGASREAALMAKLEAAEYVLRVKKEEEGTQLRARNEEMEKQEPACWTTRFALNSGSRSLSFDACRGNLLGNEGVPLYTLPGAKGE